MTTRRQAIIYCRKASYGAPPHEELGAQEASCRMHIKERDYEVIAVIHETGSGLRAARSGMQRLSEILHRRAEADLGTVVVVDDFFRLARDPMVLDGIAKSFRTVGATVEYAAKRPSEDILKLFPSEPIKLPFPLKRGFQ